LHFKNLSGKVDHKTQIFIAEKYWNKSWKVRENSL
jgi:hypothetical protein